MIGDSAHTGIGSDLDGGFGLEKIPSEFDSAADLVLIANALQNRGYGASDIANIMGGNWIRLLRNALA